jgi:two-component system, OmpR family, KDP operon response regulator KdpE
MSVPPPSVLVIEDNAALRQLIREAFELSGFETYGAKNGTDGLKLSAGLSPVLVTLDVDLPDMSGVEVLGRLRSSSSLPVIIPSGRSDAADKVHLLGLGANDYLVKPFEIDDLLMRSSCAIRNYLRTSAGEPQICVGSLSVDLDACLAFIDEDQLELTPAEYRLIRILVEHGGNVATDHRLLKDIWGSVADAGDLPRLRDMVRDLQERIEPHPHRPRLAREFRVGYRLLECRDTATSASPTLWEPVDA